MSRLNKDIIYLYSYKNDNPLYLHGFNHRCDCVYAHSYKYDKTKYLREHYKRIEFNNYFYYLRIDNLDNFSIKLSHDAYYCLYFNTYPILFGIRLDIIKATELKNSGIKIDNELIINLI